MKISDELYKNLVAFVTDLKESLRHNVTLGCGPELDQYAIYCDAAALLASVEAEEAEANVKRKDLNKFDPSETEDEDYDVVKINVR
jgi:hypothetical protein